MTKKTISQNNFPSFWNRVTAYINDRLPKGALAAKDTAPISMGGTNATTAKDARENLGITYGTEIPTEAPVTGSGAIYFFEDDYTPVSVIEGGTGAKTAEGALENLGVADYIIETGTDGIWTYEKWNSGKAKCWGVKSYGNISIDTAWGNVYVKSNAISAVTYPFAFLEPPVVHITEEKDGTDTYWIITGLTGTATQTPAFGVARATIDYDTAVKVYFEVTGKWK